MRTLDVVGTAQQKKSALKLSAHEAAWRESAEAIAAVDSILAIDGLRPGRRATRTAAWADGDRVIAPKRVQAARLSGWRAKRNAPVSVLHISGWDRYAWLRAGFSTRHGGASSVYGPAELNLGWTPADNDENVADNRRRFALAVGGGTIRDAGTPMELATLRQVHSGIVHVVRDDVGPLTRSDGRAQKKGDGWMTARRGLLLGVQTADCVPVLVADVRRKVVAAFHAGWRGTLARIVERGIGTMRLEFGSKPQDLVAAIGPSIGACCYAVGEEVRSEFESQFAYGLELFSEVSDSDPVREKYPLLFLTARAPGHSPIGPQIHVDLWDANRRQLIDAGVRDKAIWVAGECTGCTREKDGRLRYYSHRMEHGFAGRMMAAIGMV